MNLENLTRVDEDLFNSDGDLTIYNGTPFTGIGYDPFPSGEGVEYETTYYNGLPHGVSRKWHSPERLAYEVECQNGATHGAETHWYPNGKIKSEAQYEFGIKIFFKAWNEHGQLVEEFKIDPDSTNFKLLQKYRQG